MSDLKLDVDQASELKAAFRRGDWTNADIKLFSEASKEKLKLFRNELRGELTVSELKLSNPYLRLISGGEALTISARDGSRTIAKAKNTFLSGVDRDFTSWGLDNKGGQTEETPVDVYEMIKDANFKQMFTSLSPDLDKLSFTQDQIIEFCEKHQDWLRTDGYATLFLFKENGKFFVAYTFVFSRGLHVYLRRIEDVCVWDAEFRHRLVVPQLTA